MKCMQTISVPTEKGKTMTDREKLLELLKHDNCPIFMVFGDNIEGLADYLIANGVTIPVRCNDCKFALVKLDVANPFIAATQLVCSNGINWRAVEPNHSCSYGERKDNER